MISVLYDLIYMIPVGVAAVYAAESYAGLSAPGPAGYMVMMLTVGICLAMRYFESRVKYLIPGMLTAIAAGIVLIREKDERAGFLISCSWILWIALTGIACYLLCRLITRYIWVRRGFSLLLILMLLIMMLRGAEGGKAVVALIFLPLLSSAAEEVQLCWDKSGYTDRKGHIVSLVPFLLIVCIAVYLLPSSDRPYDWGFVKRICEGAEELARRTADLIHFKDEYYGAVIGFSDESGFAGSLERKTESVMTLRCEGEAPEAVYLAGKTFDTFDGRKVYENIAIRLTKAGRQFALAHVLHSKQKFTKDDGDTYTMNTPPTTKHLVVEWILSQRGNAVPLSPAELVEDVRTASLKITDACTVIQEEGK